MKKSHLVGVVLILLMLVIAQSSSDTQASAATPDPKGESKQAGPRTIDLAICLDTSNSMDGLIDSAKQKLWAIVNELATAKPKPILRVALYQYGNTALTPESGWVQQVSDLTDDLDTIYGKLFALRTSGGTEYVARVVRAATNDLHWREENRPMRIIVVAGNEPATQDRVHPLQDICRAAANKGIVINTIFCGNETEGYRTGWADAARWADGKYAAINADKGTVVIETPYDKKITELGVELNKTYVPYGAKGVAGASNQLAQDSNAAVTNAPASADRAVSKASGLYRNAYWDLVDAAKEKDFDLSKILHADLPAEMQKMSPDQRKTFLAERAIQLDLQKQICELNNKREEALKQEQAKQGLTEKDAFDAALRGAVREQAQKNGFEFEKK